jgi:hypothetical protein
MGTFLPQALSVQFTNRLVTPGMPISAWLRTGPERSARQQQLFARSLSPNRVLDPVLLPVLSCPFYGVTPTTRD